MFSDAEFTQKKVKKKEKCISNFVIKDPPRKNKFTLRKIPLFKYLGDDVYMEDTYKAAKKILKLSVREYSTANPSKPENSIFKNRGFDKDYLRPVISKFVDNKEKKK